MGSFCLLTALGERPLADNCRLYSTAAVRSDLGSYRPKADDWDDETLYTLLK